ncbi:hypothetical protein RDV89_13330 [Nocardioides zeae]|uniref:SPW repeat-containing protein n=1 Tax=Nocardioides imazamoxiresistens TaxID=3231893 RepID=A0ABU3PY19_9ACTN|nr:hypothetical protein [Nocardioides zeae]MDT9594059.1 hypothetical protein [Nocardioides zeae]
MSESAEPSRGQRVLAGVAALLAGAMTGLSAVVVHSSWWGLLLAVAGTVAALVVAPAALWARGPFVLGWVGLVLLAVAPRREGDYLVAASTNGYVLLALTFGVALVGIVAVARGGRRANGGRPHPEG